MAVIPDDPDARLTRDAAAKALMEAGFPVRKATLATLASRGGGPPFRKLGTRPICRWGDFGRRGECAARPGGALDQRT